MTSDTSAYTVPSYIHRYSKDSLGSTTWTEAPEHWLQRAIVEDILHLMEKSPAGPLICVSRGKLVLMAAGHHACLINFGLEANIIGMKLDVFHEIVSEDYPGPNPHPEKSEFIRTFRIPERFIVEHSSRTRPRPIKLYAAFISPKWVWAINDFYGLVRTQVTSRRQPWERSDFEVGNSVHILFRISSPRTNLTFPFWQGWRLFDHFKGGPDWYLERPLATAKLDAWRQDVLAEYETFLRKAKPSSTFSIDSYFT